MTTPPVEQLQKMTAETFFNRLADLLKSNPPPASEAPLLAKGLETSVAVALEKLRAASRQSGALVDGWRVPPNVLGDYGTDYGSRAVVAPIGLGANLPADAVYPSAYVDGEGRPLSGANRYVLHFDQGSTPPVDAFWSVTTCNPQSFFADNPINRYAVGSWMPLDRNSDGSLDIQIQRQSPG